jgi:hypothetical protein
MNTSVNQNLESENHTVNIIGNHYYFNQCSCPIWSAGR